MPHLAFYEIAAQVLPFFALSSLLGATAKGRSYADAILVLVQFAAFSAGESVALTVIYHQTPPSDRQNAVVIATLIASGAALAMRAAAQRLRG
jgi:hypothetical protein